MDEYDFTKNEIFDDTVKKENFNLNLEIMNLENQIELMEKHIKLLWDNVIVSYLTNYEKRQILNKITENDYNKFYKFMINKNSSCKYMIEKLNYLYSLK